MCSVAMMETKHVVIVGGGTAGWLAAARLGAMRRAGIGITVVESPNVATVGVGEGTWPSMRTTLQSIGLSERDVLRHCNASLKQGTLFQGWRNGGSGDSYLHPFSLPPEYANTNLAECWRTGSIPVAFSDAVTAQSALVAQNRAPKTTDTPDYAFAVNYGYHLDAVKFASLLRQHSVERLGVVHISDHVTRVHLDEAGFIASIDLQNGEKLCGDLFIDCTGQRSLLLAEVLGAEFTSVADILPNNRALVAQVPYADASAEINSCTLSTAMDNGWVWDIGLQNRRGVGYVHDANRISVEQAETTLRDYIASTSDEATANSVRVRALEFDPGYRATPWLKNCVAIGLSAGFIEPLEASALAMIEQGVSWLVENFPSNRALMEPVGRSFNRKMTDNWDSIVEFLKLHYVLSKRDDSEYWRFARSAGSTPQVLLDKLALWQLRAPWHTDSPRVDALFPAASYQYVWLGMDGHAESSSPPVSPDSNRLKSLDRTLNSVREKALALSRSMPGNRELLTALCREDGATERAVG